MKKYYLIIVVTLIVNSSFGQVCVISNEKYGLIDSIGNFILKPICDIEIPKFLNKTSFVSINGKYGFINDKGEFLIQPTYEAANYFNDGLAPVKKNGKWGYINNSNQTVIDFQYDDCSIFIEGFAIIKKGDLYGYIDNTGKEITPCIFYDARYFHSGKAYATMKFDGEVYDITKNGIKGINKDLKQPPYWNWRYELALWNPDALEYISYSSGQSYKPTANGYKNYDGIVKIAPQFYNTSEFNEGVAAVTLFDQSDKGFGYIDKDGNFFIEPQYIRAFDFCEGIAAVVTSEGLGFINKKSEWVIKPKKEWTTSSIPSELETGYFHYGLCRIIEKVVTPESISRTMIYVNKIGEIVFSESKDIQLIDNITYYIGYLDKPNDYFQPTVAKYPNISAGKAPSYIDGNEQLNFIVLQTLKEIFPNSEIRSCSIEMTVDHNGSVIKVDAYVDTRWHGNTNGYLLANELKKKNLQFVPGQKNDGVKITTNFRMKIAL